MGDDAYGELLVWRDLDQDGYSDDGELFALNDPSIQIKEISLAETTQEGSVARWSKILDYMIV